MVEKIELMPAALKLTSDSLTELCNHLRNAHDVSGAMLVSALTIQLCEELVRAYPREEREDILEEHVIPALRINCSEG